MRIKKISARDMAEVVKKTREELGPMAVVLALRRVTDPRTGEKLLEATAATDDAPADAKASATAGTKGNGTVKGKAASTKRKRKKPAKKKKSAATALKEALTGKFGGKTIKLPLPSLSFTGRAASGGDAEAAGKTPLDEVTAKGEEILAAGEFDPRRQPHWTEDEYYAGEPQAAEASAAEEFPVAPAPAADVAAEPADRVTLSPRASRVEKRRRTAVSHVQWCMTLGRLAAASRERMCTMRKGTAAAEAPPPTTGAVDGDAPVLVLFGPKGTGKSTTAAKLAVRLRETIGKPSGLISLDVYRPGGLSLTAAYAGFFGIPLVYAQTAPELLEIVKRWDNRGPLVVDGEGFAPDDRAAVAAAAARFGVLHGRAQLHLVLNATAHPELTGGCLMLCRELPRCRLLLTRMDEGVCARETLASAREAGVPLSYLGMGPRVPEDLAEPTEAEWRELAGEAGGVGKATEEDAAAIAARLEEGREELDGGRHKAAVCA